MTLHRLGSVGTAGEVKRAFAFSFLSRLWLVTGMEDNGGGTNNLFYMDVSGSAWRQQDEISPYFEGRLHGGVVFQSRICLFLGDNIGTASRYTYLFVSIL